MSGSYGIFDPSAGLELTRASRKTIGRARRLHLAAGGVLTIFFLGAVTLIPQAQGLSSAAWGTMGGLLGIITVAGCIVVAAFAWFLAAISGRLAGRELGIGLSTSIISWGICVILGMFLPALITSGTGRVFSGIYALGAVALWAVNAFWITTRGCRRADEAIEALEQEVERQQKARAEAEKGRQEQGQIETIEVESTVEVIELDDSDNSEV